MKRVHIVGGKNHGKTTLIVELVELYRKLGIAVGTIKHTRHFHELDRPGKDSYRHRASGADPAAVLSQLTNAVYMSALDDEQDYARLEPLYAHCRLVLVEGHLDARRPKVEVWRRELGTSPLYGRFTGIAALISDDPVEDVPVVWKRSEVGELADRLLKLAEAS